MKRFHCFTLMIVFLLTGCTEDNAQFIAQDVEKHNQHDQIEGHNLVVPEPNNKEQNRHRVQSDEDVRIFADEFGFYLDQFYLHLENIRPIYADNQVSEQTEATLLELQNLSNHMLTWNVPEPFLGLHDVHTSTLLELDTLTNHLFSAINDNDSTRVRQSLVYYENTMISLKLMEREYKEVVEELGIK